MDNKSKKEVKKVEVTVAVDNLKHAGEPCEKGDKLTVTEGQAAVMLSMKVIEPTGAKQ